MLKRKKPLGGLPVSQITSFTGPKHVQLWRPTAITVTHEKVSAVDSPGRSQAEANEMLCAPRRCLGNRRHLVSRAYPGQTPSENDL